MASNRIGRINEEIQRELASLLRTVKDPRVHGLVSITHVETTPADRCWQNQQMISYPKSSIFSFVSH